LVSICLSLPLVAQESRATITGRVTDPSAAAVVGAKVQATNIQTGVAVTATSNESGAYLLPFLLPGKYRVTAEATGFKKWSQNELELRVNDSVALDVRLEVGGQTEMVEVTAGAPPLETADASLGNVIDQRALQELPQRGGNPLELERLNPGVVNLTTLRIMKPSSPDGTSSISVNGSGNFQTQYNLDGVTDTTNDRGRGYARVAYIPPSVSVTEFKMQSNPYDASVGHTFGPVINVGTKSGTNSLHGTVYYWGRNSAFDSANFFDNKAGLKKVVYQDHRFGASAGGPALIPRVHDGRNKTFWFYAWEENRFGQPSTSNQTSTVPTAAERTGDFSALLALNSSYQIYSPFSTRPDTTAGRYRRDPFPGNIIPKQFLSAPGLALANLYPLPSQTPSTTDGRNNYYFPDVRQQRYDSHLARVDHAFTPNHRMFGRVTHFAYVIPKDLLGIPATKEIFNQNNQGIALDDVIVVNSSTVVNIRYGLVAVQFPERRVTQGTDLAKLGFSPAFAALLDPATATIPRVTVSGFATLSNWSDGDGQNTALTHNLVGDVTKLHGSHTLKFGADGRLFRTFANRVQTTISPDLSFANTYTKGPLDNSTAASLGQELAALLMGIPGGSMTRNPTATFAAQNKYFGVYLQDDIKVTPKLTVNLGLRYEYEAALTERFNRLVTAFDASATSPIAAQAIANYAAIYAKTPIAELPPSAFQVKGGLLFAGVGGRSRSPFNGNNGEWLPRLGLAYRINDKTVLRSGYGIYFGTLGVDAFIPQQAGFSQSTPIQASLDNGQTYPATLANPLPSGLLPALGSAGGLGTNLGQNVSAFDPNMKQPYSQRWSLGVQRFLPGRFVLDVSYVGNRNTHLPVAQQANATPAQYLSTSPFRDQPVINSLTQSFASPFAGLNSVFGSTITRAALLQPFPEFGTISIQRSMGYSWYHALQVKADKRLARGVSAQLGYTWSKYMQATEFQNASDARPYRAISDADRTHVFTLSGVWELPLYRKRWFGGWQLNGTAIRQSGTPLGFGNALFIGHVEDIPLPKDQRSPDRWLNTDAGFNKVSAQQLANNIQTFPIRFSGIRSDGQSTWNFSLFKDFRIAEKAKAQFRAEVYNSMNHPSFDVPNTSPTNSSFGTVTAVVSEPRNWQFALKLSF
jgi:outer membrane receptor protein involved in Fe transport